LILHFSLDKYSRKDPAAWIKEEPKGRILPGMAHGNVEGLPLEDMDHPIPRDAAQRAGLDYRARRCDASTNLKDSIDSTNPINPKNSINPTIGTDVFL
jgi:hypothetical protein